MIKLKFLFSHPVERTYHSSRVVLGAGSMDLRELPLDVSSLQAEHLVLFEQEGEFWAFNRANDPFVTVNERPFGRKVLRNGDRLEIAGITVLFDAEVTAPPQKKLTELEDILARKMHEKAGEYASLAGGARKFVAKQGGDAEVIALLEQVEALEPREEYRIDAQAPSIEEEAPEVVESPANAPEQPAQPFFKIEAAGPIDASVDLAAVSPFIAPSEDSRQGISWKLLLVGSAAFLLILVLSVLGIYAVFAEQSDKQDYMAAQDVADVAMALTYAQVHQVKPQNQNWADPDFIRANLQRILDGRFSTATDFDPQGYLKNSSYLLRIYTSHDFAQFLLVAQPAPSLWHWFTRRQSVLLDSTTMQLRRTSDIRGINRLMSNPNALGGASALEVSKLVYSGEPMSLKTLSWETGLTDFAPPRELKKLRPGAENLVHNAPRYYRFTEPLVMDLASDVPRATEEERATLGLMQSFSRLSNLVLYSSTGVETAKKAYLALQKDYPTENFLVGYLNFDPTNHELISGHLVDETTVVPISEGGQRQQANVVEHPVRLAIQALAAQRKEVLQPLNEQMIKLLESHHERPTDQFYAQMTQLLSRYQTIDEPHRRETRLRLADLYRKYVVMEQQVQPLEFAEHTRATGLDEYLSDFAALEPAPADVQALSQSDFEPILKKIQDSRTLAALDTAVASGRQWVLWQGSLDAEKTTSYLNKLRSQTISRLEQFLFSPSSPLDELAFRRRNRALLVHVFNQADISDSSQRDFYLKEFDDQVGRYEKRDRRGVATAPGTSKRTSYE